MDAHHEAGVPELRRVTLRDAFAGVFVLFQFETFDARLEADFMDAFVLLWAPLEVLGALASVNYFLALAAVISTLKYVISRTVHAARGWDALPFY